MRKIEGDTKNKQTKEQKNHTNFGRSKTQAHLTYSGNEYDLDLMVWNEKAVHISSQSDKCLWINNKKVEEAKCKEVKKMCACSFNSLGHRLARARTQLHSLTHSLTHHQRKSHFRDEREQSQITCIAIYVEVNVRTRNRINLTSYKVYLVRATICWRVTIFMCGKIQIIPETSTVVVIVRTSLYTFRNHIYSLL